jgi:ABC-type multidrug transport system permease subunit
MTDPPSSRSICMVIGVLAKRLSTGSLAASMFMLFSLMLTDIFNNKATMPPSLRWLHYASFFNYGYEVLCVNELDGMRLDGSFMQAKGLQVRININ